MAGIERVGDLEIAHDERFERAQSRVNRVALVVLPLLLVATLLGVFGGSGLLSDARVRSSPALAVDFERFARLGASTQVVMAVGRGDRDLTNVAVKGAWLEGFRVDAISPQPDSVTGQPDRLVYSFDLDAPAEVAFTLTPEEIGVQRAFVELGGGERVTFTQFVLP